MYLDQLKLEEQIVGYGGVGMRGALGYDGLSVSVQRQPQNHALSAHAPSRLVFDCEGRFQKFGCRVALNDDVAHKGSTADFVVLADNRVVGAAPQVRAGDPPRELSLNINGCRRLELVAQTTHFAFCHSLWLEPQVFTDAEMRGLSRSWSDALGRVQVHRPETPALSTHCVATVVSAGYADLLDGLLGSLRAQNLPPETLIVVFNIGNDARCSRMIAHHKAYEIGCERQARCNAAIKSVLYSVASLVDADNFICLDADMLVLDDLGAVFEAINAHAPDTILIVRDAFLTNGNLLKQLCSHYRGERGDLSLLPGPVSDESNYDLIVNDGLFAGSRRALLGIDNLIRNMPGAATWVDYYPDHGWRNQFVFNLALARLRCGVELDSRYNLQMHMNDATPQVVDSRLRALWRGRHAHVLHFCGWGRDKYLEWRKRLPLEEFSE
jgi:hypothetical protein